MATEEFLEYLRDTLAEAIGDSGDILITHSPLSFIYVDVENEAFYKVSIATAEVK